MDERETLTISQKIVGHLGYHGHISLDRRMHVGKHRHSPAQFFDIAWDGGEFA